MTKTTWGVPAVLSVMLLATAGGRTAASTWTNPANGAFNDSGNWDSGVPTSSAPAVFNDGNTHVVGFSGDQDSQGITVSSPTAVTLNLGTGNTYTVASGISSIDGTLEVINGGTLDARYTTGDSIQINGGTLKVLSGATIVYGGPFPYTGINLAGTGAAIMVDGNGSLLDGSGGYVDRIGASAVTISNGGTWKTPYLYGSGPNITVTGANSKFINAPASPGVDLSAVTGFLTINDGGSWSSGMLNLGYGAAAVPMTVGGAGAAATMEVTHLHLFGSSGWANVNAMVKSNGMVTVTGGGGDDVRVVGGYGDVASYLTLEGGTVAMASGTTLAVQGNVYGGGFTAGGTLRGSGTIQRSGVSGSFAINNTAGSIKPGDTTGPAAIGTITVADGDLTQTAGGTTYFDFAAGGSSDRISITGGVADISGTVTYSIFGPTPDWTISQSWIFLQADTINYTASDNMLSLLNGYGVTPYFYGIQNNGSQDFLVLMIPEPSSVALLGLCGLLVRRGQRAGAR